LTRHSLRPPHGSQQRCRLCCPMGRQRRRHHGRAPRRRRCCHRRPHHRPHRAQRHRGRRFCLLSKRTRGWTFVGRWSPAALLPVASAPRRGLLFPSRRAPSPPCSQPRRPTRSRWLRAPFLTALLATHTVALLRPVLSPPSLIPWHHPRHT
jgi:hypothetical protein